MIQWQTKTHTCKYRCIYRHTHTYIHTYIHMNKQIYVYIYIYTHTYIHKCKYTYIHTFRRSYPEGYCHWKWNWWSEFKFWTSLFAVHFVLKSLRKAWTYQFSFQLWVNSRADLVFILASQTSLGERKLWILTCGTLLKHWPFVTYCPWGSCWIHTYIHVYI